MLVILHGRRKGDSNWSPHKLIFRSDRKNLTIGFRLDNICRRRWTEFGAFRVGAAIAVIVSSMTLLCADEPDLTSEAGTTQAEPQAGAEVAIRRY